MNSTMGGYWLDFHPHPVGLRVCIHGGRGSLETKLACWREVASEVAQREPAGLLVMDQRMGTPITPEQFLLLLDGVAGLGLDRLPLAYVSEFGGPLELMNLALIDRDYVARVFENEQDAVRWLRHGER